MKRAMLLLPALLFSACGGAVAIGDSITEHGGWVQQYDSMMVNEGRSGETSAQILYRVEHDSTLRQELAEASLVTLQAGTNDLAQQVLPPVFCANWAQLVRDVQSLTSATIVVQDIYHWAPDVVDRVRVMNTCIRETLGVRVAHVEARFGSNTAYLLPDAIHPNALGDAAIVEELQNAD